MNTTSNKKLCWNCDGNVDKEAVQCVYCGVSLPPVYDDDEPAETPSTNSKTSSIPYPPYSSGTAETISSYGPPAVAEVANKSRAPSFPAVPFALLLSGVVLFVFAVMLLFFSRDGVLTLRWDADYWFVYLAAGLPLLFFGWKFLGSPREEE